MTAEETPAAPVVAPATPLVTPPARPGLELLKRRRGSMIRKVERRGLAMAMRSMPDGTGGTDFEFTGYGATFDDPFPMYDSWGEPYTEVVRQGAFTQTLAQPGLDVPFLIGHRDDEIPLARTRNGTMTLSQDSHGLLVEARMDGRRSDVRDLAYAVERGDMSEMSIGFMTLGQDWSPDWETRAMTELDLHRGDVSAVALAANPATAGASMVAFPAEILRSGRPAEQRAQDEVVDTSKQPDFNMPDQDPANDGQGAKPCPHGSKNGCSNMCSGDSKFCSNCGGALYQGDGTMVLDDSGVVEEVSGAMADADLLSAKSPNSETMSMWLELDGIHPASVTA